jgi:coiled-coil domain-containing protein 63/114
MATKLRQAMASAGGDGSETGAFDDAQKTHDLSQLQREYRHMELNRRAYADESQQMLRKQTAAIEKLRRENDALKTSLAMEFRQFKKPAETGLQDKLSKLQDQADWYVKHIEAEKAGVKVMAEQVSLMRQKVLHQRKSMGGVNAAKENEQMVQKQVSHHTSNSYNTSDCDCWARS